MGGDAIAANRRKPRGETDGLTAKQRKPLNKHKREIIACYYELIGAVDPPSATRVNELEQLIAYNKERISTARAAWGVDPELEEQLRTLRNMRTTELAIILYESQVY